MPWRVRPSQRAMAGTVHRPALTTLRTCHRATVWPHSLAIASLVRRDRPASSYTSAISSRYCSLASMTIACHNDNMLSNYENGGFIDALHVSGPAAEYAGRLMLFGQFVGSWDLEWAGTGADA